MSTNCISCGVHGVPTGLDMLCDACRAWDECAQVGVNAVKCRPCHGVGDKGQRYETRYLDEKNVEHVMGWSDMYPDPFLRAIALHPVFHSPRVIDRGKGAIAFDDLPPIDITGGVPSEEHVRRVRDGD